MYLQIDGTTSRVGPYVVARVNDTSVPRTYILSLTDGTLVNDGREVAEAALSR